MKNKIIVVTGSAEFSNANLAAREIKNALKKEKIENENLLIYGCGYSGAYKVTENWATENNHKFRDGSPKFNEFNNKDLAVQNRNEVLSECGECLIVLKTGTSNGGNTLIEAFESAGKNVYFVDSLPKASEKEIAENIEFYSKLARALIDSGSVMLDTETTGLSYDDEIVEISVGNLKTQEIIYSTLVKAQKESNPKAAEINGITPKLLKNAPTISDVWSNILKAVGSNLVLASNSAFDERMLKQSLEKHGIVPAFEWFDIQTLYRFYSTQHPARDYPLKTEGMCIQVGVTPGHHRADSDVLAQMALVKAMADKVVPRLG